jgi:cytochrome c-type biogenesis protein CcmH/NrfF
MLLLVFGVTLAWMGAMTPQEEMQARIEAQIYSGCGARKLLRDDICDIAQETRAFVQSLVAQNLSEPEILAALEERYGAAILAIPERNWLGKLSYMFPYIVAALGLMVVTYFLRGRSARPLAQPSPGEAPAPDSEDRKRKIEAQVLSDL